MDTAKKMLKKCFIAVLLCLFITAFVVVLVDPFFHYHGCILGLKPIQVEEEYQVNGALDHLDYNALLVGSSVVMNINNNILDDIYGCESIKAVASGATTDTLCYYINRAYKSHDVDYIFYGLDVFFLEAGYDDDSTQDQAIYLRNKNIFDDVEYWYNADVLFKYIPDMIIQSFKNYDDGMAYNFAKYISFNADIALDSYLEEYGDTVKYDKESKPMPEDYQVPENVKINIDHIKEIVSSHPETQFVFFFPVRSVIHYDRVYENVELEEYAYMKYAVLELTKYENVKFYCNLLNDYDSVMNLNNYNDWVHSSYEVNCEMARHLSPDSLLLTEDNIDEQLDILRGMVNEFEAKLKVEQSYDFLR